MTRSNTLLVFFAVVLTFTAFYAPQPLLPMLAAELGVSRASVSLLVSVTMLPLALAPLLYGVMLQSLPVKRLLIASTLGLAATSLLLAMGPDYDAFLALRLVQGLLLPAMMTALMTYVAATAEPERLSGAMAAYVATTVAGGFLGRLFAGQVTVLLGWQGMFAVLGGLLFVLGVALTRLKGEPRADFARFRLSSLSALLSVPGLRRAYVAIFCAFFVFAALLNFLPFRLADMVGDISPARISLMYTGYLMGIVVALLSGRLIRILGSARRAVLAGFLVYLVAIGLFAIPSPVASFLTMFLFCAGMFTVHGVLPGLVNHLAPEHRGMVNGLYLCAYYLGGTLGAWLPGYVFEAGGWLALLTVLAGMVMLAIANMTYASGRGAE